MPGHSLQEVKRSWGRDEDSSTEASLGCVQGGGWAQVAKQQQILIPSPHHTEPTLNPWARLFSRTLEQEQGYPKSGLAESHRAECPSPEHRYDHYSVLCELLPVGIPSLAVCLQSLLHGMSSQ